MLLRIMAMLLIIELVIRNMVPDADADVDADTGQDKHVPGGVMKISEQV